MPYSILKKKNCYSVINSETLAPRSVCTTEDKARKQLRLLNAIKHGWKPRGRGVSKKKKKLSGTEKALLAAGLITLAQTGVALGANSYYNRGRNYKF
jgi:hypothetical protein